MKERFKAHSRTFRSWRFVSAGLLLGLSFTLAADEVPLSETRLADLGPEAYFQVGEQVTGQVCTICHGWDIVLANRLTPSQWKFLVPDMVARGASATNEQQEFITRFMSWAWGQVSVNSAAAEDLAVVIGLPQSQAEAVVAYRESNGPFANLESLKQVPGIDTAALDRQVDALLFN